MQHEFGHTGCSFVLADGDLTRSDCVIQSMHNAGMWVTLVSALFRDNRRQYPMGHLSINIRKSLVKPGFHLPYRSDVLNLHVQRLSDPSVDSPQPVR